MSTGTETTGANTAALSGVLAGTLVRKRKGSLEPLMPLITVDDDRVILDISKSFDGGMSPITVPGTPSPIMSKSINAGGRMVFEAVEVREKVVVDASDMRSIRRLGTEDEEISIDTAVLKYTMHLKRRLETRQEWMRAKALFNGSFSYSHATTGEVFTINYPHPAYLEPNAGTAWTNAAALPLSDMSSWAQLFKNMPMADDSPIRVIMSPTTVMNIKNTDQFKNLYADAWKSRNMSVSQDLAAGGDIITDAMRVIFSDFLGTRFTWETYDSSVMHYSSVASVVSDVATTIVVLDATGMEIGDTVILQDRATGVRIERALTGVNLTTNTLTIAAATGVAFPVGTVVTARKPLMPQNKVIMLGTPELNLSTLEDQLIQGVLDSENPILPDATIGKMVSTRNKYHVTDRSPGYFSYTIENDGDPPRTEIIGGIMVLPRIDYPELFVRAGNV